MTDKEKTGEDTPEQDVVKEETAAEAQDAEASAAEEEEKAAENGLGIMYSEGKGVKQDFQAALYWFKRSARHGNALAYINLGVRYKKGEGVPKNCQLAIDWFEKAKESGYTKANSYIMDTKLTCE